MMKSRASMPRTLGHETGQGPGAAGFSWADYLDWLVETHGSLAAVASRLASLRAYADDVGSIERALRRLRSRGQLDGGTWGGRALAAFGLPGAADARVRWMGAYHSRFTDLPVPLCQDLVRLWDRPPLADAPQARMWLALAHATCALRTADREGAALHLQRARASRAGAPPEARTELALLAAFIASREEPSRVDALLAEAEPILELPMDRHDRACLFARWIDQRAYTLNKQDADLAGAEALYRTIPNGDGEPPFALCRRGNGLAYAAWKQGRRDEAIAFAREASRTAGDGGHLRLRAMALTMLGRILGGEEGQATRARAIAIVTSLEDEALRLRFRAPGRPPA